MLIKWRPYVCVWGEGCGGKGRKGGGKGGGKEGDEEGCVIVMKL